MASPDTDFTQLALAPAFARRYTLGRLLGRGAMGVVYEGTHVAMRRRVAIKFLTKLGNRESQQRFLREARLMAEVQHPHVAQVFDLDELEGHPFLVTEFLEGGTLRDMLGEGSRLRPAEAVAIARECLAGLAACHEKGIVHRDLKPENILFSDAGAAKIADLGIARGLSDGEPVTREGALMGTPLYMAPEQVAGERAGPASDLYALAVLLYEMLAGRPPFQGANGMAVMRQQLSEPPPSLGELAPEVPGALAAEVHRGLAKEPRERHASAAQFAAALAAALPAPAPDAPPASATATSPGLARPAAGAESATPAPDAVPATPAAPARLTHTVPVVRPRLPAPVAWALALALAWAGATALSDACGPTAMDVFATLTLPQHAETLTPEARLANVKQSRVVVIDTSEGATPAGVDRGTLAKLVARASELGASAIGLAVLLDRPGDAAADRALASAIRASGRVVVAHHYNRNTLAETRSLFAGDALAAGMVNLLVDRDGRARHLQNYFDEPAFQARHSLSLALAALLSVAPKPPFPAPEITDDALRFTGPNGLALEVPVDAEGASLLQYEGATGTIPRLTWQEALAPSLPAKLFTGKAVLLGEAHPQSESSFPAPFFTGENARVTSVEIHAQNVLGLLAHADRREATPGLRRALVLAGMLGGVVLSRCASLARAAALGAGGAAVVVAASYAAFSSEGLFVDPTGPLSAGLFLVLARLAIAGRRRPAVTVPPPSEEAEDGVPASIRRALEHRYERLEPLGQGGMARVFRAYDRELDGAVAIKVPDEAMLTDARAKVRFEREARALAKLEHPHVIKIHEVGDKGVPYLAMELVDGPGLDALMAAEKPMPPARALALLSPVAGALAFCHRHGVVHRDVKPGNILVDARGQPRLTDFGLAFDEALTRITRSSASVGTPLYMAPEQLEGQRPTPAVDVYAFGVVLYEMLAGEPPFNAGRLGMKLVGEAPALSIPGLDPALVRLVAKCLALEPAARPADGAALEAELRSLQG